jgi:hypothetical protein
MTAALERLSHKWARTRGIEHHFGASTVAVQWQMIISI